MTVGGFSMVNVTDFLLFIAKDMALTVGGMTIFVIFFSFLAYTYVNMLR